MALTASQRARKKESKTGLRQSVLRTGERTEWEELGQPGRRRCRMEGELFQESREQV